MQTSALYQHPAMVEHPVLEEVLRRNAHLQNSVQFNDILSKAQRNVEQAFLIKGDTIVPIIDGQDQYDNMQYTYLRDGEKSYYFHDDHDRYMDCDLVLCSEQVISGIVLKNVAFNTVYISNPYVRSVRGENASVRKLFCTTIGPHQV